LNQPGKENEALKIIEKAEKARCANDYTTAIKARIFQQQGQEKT